jgi:hypothetical protein
MIPPFTAISLVRHSTSNTGPFALKKIAMELGDQNTGYVPRRIGDFSSELVL